jgi:hypothetical protein
MVLYVITWMIIFNVAGTLKKEFQVPSCCGGGSPLLFFAFIIYYIPLGCAIILILYAIKFASKIKKEYDENKIEN